MPSKHAPNKVQLNMRIERDIYNALKAETEKQGVTIVSYVKMLIFNALKGK